MTLVRTSDKISRQTALRNTREVDNNHHRLDVNHLKTFHALLMVFTNTQHNKKQANMIQPEWYALPTMHQVYHSHLLLYKHP